MDHVTNPHKPWGEFVSLRSIRDQGTYSKIQRHLMVENDVITDEDLRNIKIMVGGKQVEDLSAELERIINGHKHLQ